MNTMNFNIFLKLAAAAAFLWLPARAGATAPAASGNSLAAGLAAAYANKAAYPVKSPRLPGRALEAGGLEANLKVTGEEVETRVKRNSRLKEPGEAMGGGKEKKEASSEDSE